jgi:transcriptional regulator with XRE-family HTH domain
VVRQALRYGEGMAEEHLADIGAFIKEHRSRSQLSLRRLAALANVSDSYLSQIERGLYRPSADIVLALAKALNVSAMAFYERLGLLDGPEGGPAAEGGVEGAIEADPRLSASQKAALVQMYRTLLAS